MTPPVARGKIPPVGTTAWALVKHLSARQRATNCDRCPGFHRKTNTACSAALGIPTPMVDPQAFYDFATGDKLSTSWELVSETRMPRATVSSCTFRRIK